MRVVSLIVGILLLISGWGLVVLESGVDGDTGGLQIKIIPHLCIIIGGILVAIAKLKKRK